MRRFVRVGLLLSIALLIAGLGVISRPSGVAMGGGTTHLRLQLKWEPQAHGFYAAEGLEVEILPGGPYIMPEKVVAEGDADLGITWLSSLLVQREQGADLVNIAQVFRHSAVAQVVWRDSGITSLGDLRGKRVAVWCCGNQYELFAALHAHGIDPADPTAVTIVDQPFDMELFLRREVDAAAATTYNELAQVLAAIDPATGRPYTLDDLTIFLMEAEGTGMLEDGVFARADWLAAPGNRDIAMRFLRASFRGWITCREQPEACVDATLAASPALGRAHQRWMLNEVNALIWPSPAGIGVLEQAALERTAAIAVRFGVLATPPSTAAFRTDLAQEALAGIDEDTRGEEWQQPVVPLTLEEP
ncbi:MAG: ABC transporter substrate-binding protein [Dehalococcoidia bacterium]